MKKRCMPKKGIMAIGTLIIFIAIILISAIVAGFLIGTTGILQQRAGIVVKETEDRLTAGVEVLNFIATADLVNERLNNYEALVRLNSGSDPMNIRYVSLVFNTKDKSYPMSLQDDLYAMYGDIDVGPFNGSEKKVIQDIDLDGIEERVYLYTENSSNSTIYDANMTYLIFNFSDIGEHMVFIGDLSNVSENNSLLISFSDYPIRMGDRTYGFLQIKSEIKMNNSFPQFKLSEFPKKCTFSTLLSYENFCHLVQLGNDNLVVEKGELFKVRFSIPENLTTDDPFELQIVPKTGSIQRIKGNTPSVLVLKQVVLYP